MKKKHLVTAVGAVLAIGTVTASAAPTVYGLVDIGLQHVDAGSGQTGSKSRMSSGQSKTTRLGFTGSEDLGGGLKSLYTAEMGMKADTGAADANLFSRQIFAGLQSSLGTLTLGRQYTQENAVAALGQFAKGGTFESLNTGSGYGLDKTVRSNNYVKYTSPTFAGLKVGVGRGLGESTTGNIEANAGDYTDVALLGAWGPVKVGVSHSETKRANNTSSTTGYHEQDDMVAGNVKLGIATVYTTYTTSENRGHLAAGTGSNEQLKIRSVGVALKLGPGNLVLQHNDIKDEKTQTAKNGSAGQGVTYFWDLSKATTLYGSYSRIKNEEGATRNLRGADTSSPTAGQDPKGYSVGLRVSF